MTPARWSSLALLACVVGAGPLSGQGTATSRFPAEEYWVPDGPVHAVLEDGSRLFFGGRFDVVTPPLGAFAPVHGLSGGPEPGFPRVDGAVRAIVGDGAGGWIVGGAFVRVGGAPRQGLAHIRADGRLESWAPAVGGGTVHALARVGPLVYVAGDFTTLAGASRSHLGAVSLLDDTTPTPWAPTTNGSGVRAMQLDPAADTVRVVGQFSLANGNPRCSAAAFLLSTGLLRPWDPNLRSAGVCGDALAVAVVDGGGAGVFLGGDFLTAGGAGQVGLARVDAASGARLSYPSVTGKVEALARDGADLYVGGAFTQVGGLPHVDLARVSTAGAVDGWAPDPDGPVLALAVEGGRLYVGGAYHSLSGATRHYGAAFALPPSLPSDLDALWRPNPSGRVLAFGVSAGRLGVGGDFGGLGGLERLNAAALDLNGGGVLPWDPQVSRGANPAAVHALEIDSGTVYLGGEFTDVGGAPRHAVAAVDDTAGTPVGAFTSPLALGDVVYALSHDHSTGPPPQLYVGGAIPDGCSPSTCTHLMKLDAATGAIDLGWSTVAIPDLPVRAVRATPGSVEVGGHFTSAGGLTRFGAASLDPFSGSALALDPTVTGLGYVAAVLPAGGGELRLGGDFATVAGVTRLHAGSVVPPPPGTTTPWDPQPDFPVLALADAPAGDVYLGGYFSFLGGSIPRSRLARVDSATGVAWPWDPDVADGFVKALARGPSRITAGGDFGGVAADRGRRHLATFCEGYPPPTDLAIDQVGDNRIAVIWTADPGAVYRVFRSRRSGGPYQPLSPLVTGTGAFEDTAVEGGATYYYVVRVEQGGPTPCLSDPSNEVSAAPSGACGLPPEFDGAISAEWAPAEAFCGVKVQWRPAQSSCTAAAPRYSVYRGLSPGFLPDESNRLATLPGGTLYTDLDDVDGGAGGASYYYVVRATDPVTGEEDQNQVYAEAFVPSGCGGKPTAPAATPVVTVRSRNDGGLSSNELTWVTPVTGGGDGNFCVLVCPGSPLNPGSCTPIATRCGDPGFSVQTATHAPLTPGFEQPYVLFRTHTPSSTHTSRGAKGRPDDTPPPLEAWAFGTSAAALGTPSIYPGAAYAAVSNDRRVYGLTVGSAGGLWPAGFLPPAMNAPAQSGPAFLPTTAALGSPATLVSSTDGRVYAFDALTGTPLWASAPLAEAVFARPTAMFTEASGGIGNWVFVGTRSSLGDNRLRVLSLASGAPVGWGTFPQLSDVPDGTGVIHAPALVDYGGKRVFFGSRRRTGGGTGSGNTLWCMSLDPTPGVPCAGWPSTGGVDVDGEIDVALSLRNGRLFYATTAGEVGSVSAATGTGTQATSLAASIKGIWTLDAGAGETNVVVGTGSGLYSLQVDAGGGVTSNWGPSGGGPVSAPLVAPNGKVYVGTPGGTLRAFDLGSGVAAGVANLGDLGTPPTIGSPTRDVSANLLIVGGSDGVVYAVPVF